MYEVFCPFRGQLGTKALEVFAAFGDPLLAALYYWI